MKAQFAYSSPHKVLSHKGIRVKFKAILKGKKVCFQGNMWLEGKFLLT
ncbi:hypothetical protein MYX76_17245 [Desulfobacterota bacterium AH_259_B03_O07]|nr:hypothetical protein [Desulfobacterota bacterium AH_259_B03_O07]